VATSGNDQKKLITIALLAAGAIYVQRRYDALDYGRVLIYDTFLTPANAAAAQVTLSDLAAVYTRASAAQNASLVSFTNNVAQGIVARFPVLSSMWPPSTAGTATTSTGATTTTTTSSNSGTGSTTTTAPTTSSTLLSVDVPASGGVTEAYVFTSTMQYSVASKIYLDRFTGTPLPVNSTQALDALKALYAKAKSVTEGSLTWNIVVVELNWIKQHYPQAYTTLLKGAA